MTLTSDYLMFQTMARNCSTVSRDKMTLDQTIVYNTLRLFTNFRQFGTWVFTSRSNIPVVLWLVHCWIIDSELCNVPDSVMPYGKKLCLHLHSSGCKGMKKVQGSHK